ncbi:MAG: N-acetyltransferase [Gammaproteobacteria bacterium]|nr:N-acetyltransferase [Gammaproteobacteria bacterium]
MNIRESLDTDKESIRQLHRNAFGETEGDAVSKLAVDLLEDRTALPLLSLVAEADDEIVGNVIFSSVTIEGADPAASAYTMAPLAVASRFQGQGLGTKLIKLGLETLKARGAAIVLVLGDPNYYSRTGFQAGHSLKPPHALRYPEAWMALELVEGALENTRGTVRCAASLSAPEYW